MTILLAMHNEQGVTAHLLADDAGADVQLTFRVQAPGGVARDELFGHELKNGTEIWS